MAYEFKKYPKAVKSFKQIDTRLEPPCCTENVLDLLQLFSFMDLQRCLNSDRLFLKDVIKINA